MVTYGITMKIIIFIFLCDSSLGNSLNTTKIYRRIKEKRILDHILNPAKYDNRIRPSSLNPNETSDGPLFVTVNMYVRSISEIDDVNMEYVVQVTFREQWIDERLMFNDEEGSIKFLTLTDSSQIWTPDLFFLNEKDGHFFNILAPNQYVRIFPNGTIHFSVKLKLKFACFMDLKSMPFDYQICEIRMASSSCRSDDIVFVWRKINPVLLNLNYSKFTLEQFFIDNCTERVTTDEHSCLKIEFHFKRIFNYYLFKVYIPCCMLVILSWISFWIDEKAVTARLLFGTLTLLALSFHVAQINSCLPQTSYTKAIDVWCVTSLKFILATIFEFIAVHYLASKAQNVDDAQRSETIADYVGNNQRCLLRARAFYRNLVSKMPKSKSKRVDVISRVLFPASFILFIICY